MLPCWAARGFESRPLRQRKLPVNVLIYWQFSWYLQLFIRYFILKSWDHGVIYHMKRFHKFIHNAPGGSRINTCNRLQEIAVSIFRNWFWLRIRICGINWHLLIREKHFVSAGVESRKQNIPSLRTFLILQFGNCPLRQKRHAKRVVFSFAAVLLFILLFWSDVWFSFYPWQMRLHIVE